MDLRRMMFQFARPFRRLFPGRVRTVVAGWLRGVDVPCPVEPAGYAARADEERARFAAETTIHELPPIFHYWSNRHVRPLIEPFGFSHPDALFQQSLLDAAKRSGRAAPRFISLGAGNCDVEVGLATALRQAGLEQFTIECLELSPDMVARGRALAQAQHVQEQVIPQVADLNDWRPAGRYDAVIANQSLHHVVELEHLLASIHDALEDHAPFATSDIIGRNGHQRWPEAMAIVREYWRELPETFRYNIPLRRQETEYLDWDCSNVGFEGVRAQDILPLLIDRFGFELFIAFGNVIEPFVDRAFGWHFDPQRQWDRDFIDRVHARDEAEIAAGHITPTHLLAVVRRDRSVVPRVRDHLTPSFCVRKP